MPRLAAAVSLVLSFTLIFAHPVAAQQMRPSTAPTIDALGVGLHSTDAADSIAAVAASTASSVPRTIAFESDALLTRREHFKDVGGIVGAVGSVVWAYQATKGDAAVHLAVACISPIVGLLGHTVGGAIGYGVSFAFYPPRRVNRSMH